MKAINLLIVFSLFSLLSFAQIQVGKKDGGSVVTKLGLGVKVNDGSSLNREYVILNDANCPVQLTDAGIETSYGERSYAFKPIGTLSVKEPIAAFEVNFVLYDVFGEHIKTLSGKEITDVGSNANLSKIGSWYATENQVSEYLICVGYVAKVRTQKGTIWSYDYKAIKEQLEKLKIAFEESYKPKKDLGKE